MERHRRAAFCFLASMYRGCPVAENGPNRTLTLPAHVYKPKQTTCGLVQGPALVSRSFCDFIEHILKPHLFGS